MTARKQNRLTAAVACGLLFAVGSELPADTPVGPAIRNSIEFGDFVDASHPFLRGMQFGYELLSDKAAAATDGKGTKESSVPFAELDRATSPHLFLGELRLASQLEKPAGGPAQVQPTVASAAALYNPVNESPFRLASLPQPAESNTVQLRPAEVRPAAVPDLAPANGNLAMLPKRELQTEPAPNSMDAKPTVRPEPAKQGTKLAELPTRQSGPTVALQATEVMRAERPEFAVGEIHLASLPRFPESAGALNPTAVFAGQGAYEPSVAEGEFRLASLQSRYGEPAGPLQPAEVLPSPNSPTAPHVPALDQDRPIAALTTSIAHTSGKLPADLAMERFQGEYPAWLPRHWNEVTYFWDAPDLCYGPLRYEEVNLERFGYTHCPIAQPAVSAAHFFCATLALPYTMTMRPHRECIYPLGHYRPGSPVPYRPIWPEWRPLAASAEVGTIAGLILLIP